MSSLFIAWSLSSFLFEVPSGAWADTCNRRSLLVASALVYAAAFASWMVAPTYAGFATGFVLWGLSSAMMSGTFESLLYDELARFDAAGEFARVLGRCQSAAMVANLVASVAAAPLFALGGYPLVGWTSVAIAGVQGMLAATLPVAGNGASVPVSDVDDDETTAGSVHPGAALVASASLCTRYFAMLRSGLREAATAVDVRRVVLVSSVLVGLTAYDEYFPLVAREYGVAVPQIAVLVGITIVGQAIGTALAGRAATMAPTIMAVVVAVGGALISGGALIQPWAGFVAIGVGYGLLNNAMIISEARLQETITGPARATVTSVHGLATEVVALAVYATFVGAAQVASVPTLVALLGLPVAAVAVGVRRWMPPARRG